MPRLLCVFPLLNSQVELCAERKIVMEQLRQKKQSRWFFPHEGRMIGVKRPAGWLREGYEVFLKEMSLSLTQAVESCVRQAESGVKASWLLGERS